MEWLAHIYTEQHGDQVLIKLKRNNKTVAGITARGVVVTIKGAIDNLTDDEMIELMGIRSSVSPNAVTREEAQELYDNAANAGGSPKAVYNRSKIGEAFDYFDIGQELTLTENFWRTNPKLNRDIKVDKVYINAFYGDKHQIIEIAIEYGNTRFIMGVNREMAYEMRKIWNIEHRNSTQ